MTWVTPDASLEIREETARIAKIAHADMPYDQYPYSLNDPVVELRTHALIAKRGEEPVGLAVVEARKNVARIAWTHSGEYCGPFEEEFHWTISSIWVSASTRRSGIARAMIMEIASRLAVSVDSLSFLAPCTDDAAAFLKVLFPEGVYVTFQS